MAGPEPITPLNEGTSNQNTTKSIIEGHVSALNELLKEPSNRDLIKPMLLDFDSIQDVSDEDIEVNKKGKSKVGDEDLSKPFKEVLKCPFTRRIVEFSSPGHRMPENAKVKNNDDRRKVDERPNNVFPSVLARDLSKEALVVEAEVEGYLVQRVHIDEGAFVEIMFEHCFNMLYPAIRARLVETQTTVSEFLGEQVKPLGKVERDMCFGGSGPARGIMKYTNRSRTPSGTTNILGRPGLKQLRAISSTIHGMMKFQLLGESQHCYPKYLQCSNAEGGKKQGLELPE
ncbi:hypothetical protein Tco_0349538 [Tanacetum coccineum]